MAGKKRNCNTGMNYVPILAAFALGIFFAVAFSGGLTFLLFILVIVLALILLYW